MCDLTILFFLLFKPELYLKHTRDFERTPMQWNSSANSGFTKAKTAWLPICPNYTTLNVKVYKTNISMNAMQTDKQKLIVAYTKSQLDSKTSHLSVFKALIQLRQKPAFQYGSVKMHVMTEQIFSFVRKAFACDVYLVCMNMSERNANVSLLTSNEIAPRAYVAMYIPGGTTTDKNDEIDLFVKYKPKEPVLTKNVFLKPRDCLILTWPTSD